MLKRSHETRESLVQAMFPLRIFLTMLVIVFVAETGVMVALPLLLELNADARIAALVDSCLLTIISGPLLWWIIIRPLRVLAETEHAKATSIVETAPSGIVTVDEDGIVQSFNQAAEKIFGYSAAEMIGEHLGRLLPERLASRTQEHLLAALENDSSSALDRTIEVTGQAKNGAAVPLALSINSVILDRHRLYTGIVRDLTERKVRIRQQAVAARLVRRALICADLQPLLDETTARVAETLGVEISCVLELLADEKTFLLRAGAGWSEEAVGEATVTMDLDARQDWMSGTPFSITDMAPEKRGGIPTLLCDYGIESGVSVIIEGSGRPFGLLSACAARSRNFSEDDIQFLKAVANVITLAIERMRAELKQREHDVHRAEQMAVVAQIATAVAHELRNPLTSVKMLAQASRKDSGEIILPEEDLSVIEGEIRRMERCLQTFLDFARLPKLERSLFDLSSLVERTFALIEGRMAKQHIVRQFTPLATPVLVEADRDQIQQLLLNLALNALDAMPHGGTLKVEIEHPVNGEVEVRMLDSGPGIEPRVLAQLFQPFVSSKATGVGLGLVISQRIAEDHGGSLSASNQPEGGARLVLKLPLPRGESTEEMVSRRP